LGTRDRRWHVVKKSLVRRKPPCAVLFVATTASDIPLTMGSCGVPEILAFRTTNRLPNVPGEPLEIVFGNSCSDMIVCEGLSNTMSGGMRQRAMNRAGIGLPPDPPPPGRAFGPRRAWFVEDRAAGVPPTVMVEPAHEARCIGLRP